MSELTILDYSQLDNSELIKEDIEIIRTNIQDISSKILDTGRRLTRLKANLPHGQFLPTLEREFGLGEHTAREFMRTFKTFSNREHALVLEGMSRRAIKILTSAMSNQNFDEDTKERIIKGVKEQTQEKGEPLTEKETKELVKPYLEQIEQLKKQNEQLNLDFENEKVRVDTTKSYYQSQLEAKKRELKQLADKKAQLETKERELQQKESTLNNTVDIEVKTKLEKAQQIALADIEQQKAELKNQEKELKSQIRKQASILEDLRKQKNQFVRGSEWLRQIQDFNSMFTQRTLGINVISRIDKLSLLPDINSFDQDEKAIFEREFSVMLNSFYRNKEAWTNAVYQIDSILQSMKAEINLSQAIDTKVTKL